MLQALIFLIQTLFAGSGVEMSTGNIRSQMTGAPEQYEACCVNYNSDGTVTLITNGGASIVIDPSEQD